MTTTGDDRHHEWWDQVWLPEHPFASDDLAMGLWRTTRTSAMKRSYVEANCVVASNLLVIDGDDPDTVINAIWDRRQWLPNLVVENPANGHGHAIWVLQEPVTRTEYARRKPLAYAAAVTEGLRRSMNGDAGYSGLITKNPFSSRWNTWWFTEHLYNLRELEACLDDAELMPPPSWRRTRRKKPTGLSRNCDIFESARIWAYREARRIRLRHDHATRQDHDDLFDAILIHVNELNATYTVPLPDSEAACIARSITRWITQESRIWKQSSIVTQAQFVTIQSARAHKLPPAARHKAGKRANDARRRIRDKNLTTHIESMTGSTNAR